MQYWDLTRNTHTHLKKNNSANKYVHDQYSGEKKPGRAADCVCVVCVCVCVCEDLLSYHLKLWLNDTQPSGTVEAHLPHATFSTLVCVCVCVCERWTGELMST